MLHQEFIATRFDPQLCPPGLSTQVSGRSGSTHAGATQEESADSKLTLVLAIAGNMLGGGILLGGLVMAPYLLGRLFGI